MKSLEEAGYKTPTPIQRFSIPWALQGRDVLGCAQTGTGKTASFTLPMMEILGSGRARARMPRSLILTPTRELAAQIEQHFDKLGRNQKLNTALLIGGDSMSEQSKKLDRGVDVLIATPGRLIDQFERGNILLSDCKLLVIDECDRMLDMGFIPDIERIVALLPTLRQSLLFSATLSPEIRLLAEKFLSNPKEATVSPSATVAVSVKSKALWIPTMKKRELLRHLLREEEVKNAFIFCNRKMEVAKLHSSLLRHGFSAGALHGDMPQSKRTETLEKFRQDEIKLLVCSDVAARGIDIVGVSHVFNFDIPHHCEDYVHRIGRTGRAGMEGCAFTLVAPHEGKLVEAIEKLTGTAFDWLQVEGLTTKALSEEELLEERKNRGKHGNRHKDQDRNKPREAGRPPREAHKAARAAAPRSEPAEQPARRYPAADETSVKTRPSYHKGERYPQRRREIEEDVPVLGFGDDIPAFMLLRPVFLDVSGSSNNTITENAESSQPVE
ncbi:MAG: DEAD/DEAH box helicase [Alphaproteobacteria bacterium]